MTLQNFKEELNRVFDDNLHTKQWHNIVDYTIIGFIVLSTVEVFLTTFDTINEKYETALYVIDWITQIFFTIEVTLRIWNADMLDPKYKGFWGRVRYCISFYGLIDLLSTYPFYLSFFMPIPYMALKVLRVARLFRVFRYLHSFKLLTSAFRSKKSELLVSMQFLVIITLILSFILFFVEHDAQPEAYDNGWYSVIWAFAQYVGDPGGFGEYPPITVTGQVIAFIIGILGIAMFAVPAGLIGSGFTEVMEEEQKEKKIQGNIERIRHSFKFVQDQHFTKLLYVANYVPVDNVMTRKFIPHDDIMEAVEKSDCFHLFNLAQSANKEDNPLDRIVIVNYVKNRPYGCCINRNSKVTIVCTTGFTEPICTWFGYHIAKIGGFNFISKEIEVNPDEPVTYYNPPYPNECPNFQMFLDDLNALCEDGWAIMPLEATGPRSRPHHLHFCFNTEKGNEEYNDPNSFLKDYETFERMYQDMTETVGCLYNLLTDKNKYYKVSEKTNLARLIKAKNTFTLRVEAYAYVQNQSRLALAKTIADVFNRNFEPDVEKTIPSEMQKRQKGHDYGMQDYVD